MEFTLVAGEKVFILQVEHTLLSKIVCPSADISEYARLFIKWDVEDVIKLLIIKLEDHAGLSGRPQFNHMTL